MQQDPSTYSSPMMNMNTNPQFPEHEHLKCPRCDSNNTKFCYYNNYNLSQPRHFCKSCRRYWTKGGTLRNIPIGGGTRKSNKRSTNPNRRSSSSSSSSVASPAVAPAPPQQQAAQPKPEPSGVFGFGGNNNQMEAVGASASFSSLLGTSHGQFGNLLMDGLSPNLQMGGGFSNTVSPAGSEGGVRNTTDDLLSVSNQSGGESWNEGGENGNGWPDLSIYTPGSSFH